MNERLEHLFPEIDFELDLDERTLPCIDHFAPAQSDQAARIRELTAERTAAYGQMQRMMADINRLRESEQRLAASRQGMMTDMLYRMALLSEYRKGGSTESVVRIGTLAALLAHAIGQPDAFCDVLQLAAPLHDIGEICLPDALLGVDEFDASLHHEMQIHCLLGARLLASANDPVLATASVIAESHHERFDGSGYPRALRGEDIPLAARIVACVDVFDALTCDRPQRAKIPAPAAIDQVLAMQGCFDPEILAALSRMRDKIMLVRWTLDSANVTDELRYAIEQQLRPDFWRRFVD